MLVIVCRILIFLLACDAARGSSPWHYECINGQCQKKVLTPYVTTPHSLEVCHLICGEYSVLWPRPTGRVSLGKTVVFLNYRNIDVIDGIEKSVTGDWLMRSIDILQKNLMSLAFNKGHAGGLNLIITFDVKDPALTTLTLNTSEAYVLKIYQTEDEKIKAIISADNYFGARNGLVTLSQLIVYDDLVNEVKMISEAEIEDSPVYPYRGILLDTARNFIDKKVILRTIEAMGMSKLNTLHWHIIDSQSFPYFSKTFPLMSYYGAYSPEKVYTKKDIDEIIDFGNVHGVRIIPEFDTPAHVGEGWQWVEENFISCFKAEPRRVYCPAPPCGQLDPTHERTYNILGGIYRDLISDFQPTMFHMGGSHVNFNCWNASDRITEWMTQNGWDLSQDSFHQLWNQFQIKAHELLIKANDDEQIPTILWTSSLMNSDTTILDPAKYIIQISTKNSDKIIKTVIDKNFRVIFSNYDALFLDCGFSSWVGEGHNWCSPYKGWQTIYNNSPRTILKRHGLPDSKRHLILGGVAVLWTTQTDTSNVDTKLWPRSAALAERLWSEPSTSWFDAEQRFLRHRERLINVGIKSDSQEPEWCLHNQGQCH